MISRDTLKLVMRFRGQLENDNREVKAVDCLNRFFFLRCVVMREICVKEKVVQELLRHSDVMLTLSHI